MRHNERALAQHPAKNSELKFSVIDKKAPLALLNTIGTDDDDDDDEQHSIQSDARKRLLRAACGFAPAEKACQHHKRSACTRRVIQCSKAVMIIGLTIPSSDAGQAAGNA